MGVFITPFYIANYNTKYMLTGNYEIDLRTAMVIAFIGILLFIFISAIIVFIVWPSILWIVSKLNYLIKRLWY